VYVFEKLKAGRPALSNITAINTITLTEASARVAEWTNVDAIVYQYDLLDIMTSANEQLLIAKPFVVMHSIHESEAFRVEIQVALNTLVDGSSNGAHPHWACAFGYSTDQKIRKKINSDRLMSCPVSLQWHSFVQHVRAYRQSHPKLAALDQPSYGSSSSSSSSAPIAPDAHLPEPTVIRDKNPNYHQFFEDAWDEWSEMATMYRKISVDIRNKSAVFRAQFNNRTTDGRTTWPIIEPPSDDPSTADATEQTVQQAKDEMDAKKRYTDEDKIHYDRMMTGINSSLLSIDMHSACVLPALDHIINYRAACISRCADMTRHAHELDVTTKEYEHRKSILTARIAAEKQRAEESKWNDDIVRSEVYIKGMMAIPGMGSTEIWRSRVALTGVSDDAFQAVMIRNDLVVDKETMKAEPTVSNDCVVCLDEPKTRAFVPCGHQCVCDGCATKLQQCPICKANATSTVKIYSC
jgi:hypothetical protein